MKLAGGRGRERLITQWQHAMAVWQAHTARRAEPSQCPHASSQAAHACSGAAGAAEVHAAGANAVCTQAAMEKEDAVARARRLSHSWCLAEREQAEDEVPREVDQAMLALMELSRDRACRCVSFVWGRGVGAGRGEGACLYGCAWEVLVVCRL